MSGPITQFIQHHFRHFNAAALRAASDDYIRHLVIPDFFFHIATAHAILRHLGAPIGKRDYLGNLSEQSGGYS